LQAFNEKSEEKSSIGSVEREASSVIALAISHNLMAFHRKSHDDTWHTAMPCKAEQSIEGRAFPLTS